MPKSVLKFENNQPREVVLAFAQGKITPSNFGADQVMYTLADPPDHITFLDLGASQKLNQLRARQGERVVICKRKGAERNAPVRWDVWLANDSEKRRAAEEAGVPLKAGGGPAWGADPSPAGAAPVLPRAPAAADTDSQLERDLAASLAQRTEAAAATAAAPVTPVTKRTPTGQTQHATDSANHTAPAPRPVATKLEDALKTAVAAAYAATEYAKSIGYATMPMFTSEDLRTMANTLIIDAQRAGRG